MDLISRNSTSRCNGWDTKSVIMPFSPVSPLKSRHSIEFNQLLLCLPRDSYFIHEDRLLERIGWQRKMLVAQNCQVGAAGRERSEAEKKSGEGDRETRDEIMWESRLSRETNRPTENWNYASARVKPRNNELLIVGQVPDERTEKRQPMLMIWLN